MHYKSFSIIIGLAAGVSADISQRITPMSNANWLPLLIPAVSVVIGAIFSYAMLKMSVQSIERDVHQLRRDVGEVYDLIQDASIKIARIEGRVDRHL